MDGNSRSTYAHLEHLLLRLSIVTETTPRALLALEVQERRKKQYISHSKRKDNNCDECEVLKMMATDPIVGIHTYLHTDLDSSSKSVIKDQSVELKQHVVVPIETSFNATTAVSTLPSSIFSADNDAQTLESADNSTSAAHSPITWAKGTGYGAGPKTNQVGH